MATRPKSSLVTSAGEIGQLQFNERACAQKNLTIGGVYDILGNAAAAIRVGPFAALMVVNTDSAAHYIKFGNATVAAPTGIADGIFIPTGGVLYVSSGLNAYIRADDAKVGVYKVQDNVIAQTND